MKIASFFLLIGVILIGISLPMDPFWLDTNGHYPFLDVIEGDSLGYQTARLAALTPKFALQDYGITSLSFSLIYWSMLRGWVKPPRSWMGFLSLAIALPVVTAFGYLFDLFQGQSRWEFPHWADSLGIPMMAVPVLVLVGLVWSFGHLTLLAGVPLKSDRFLSFRAIWHDFFWLKFVFLLTVLIVLAMMAEGAYWYALSGVGWLYFYASIAAARQEI